MSLPLKSGWDKYRAIRKAFWISLLWPLIFYLVTLVLPAIERLPHEVGAFLLFAPTVLCMLLLQGYKCPRCTKPFFFRRVYQPWEKQCMHCRLPKWQEANYVDPNSPQPADGTPSIAKMAANTAISTCERDSKFLTLVLRDDPGAIHLTLDSDGWADVNNLLTRANRYGFKLTREDLVDLPAVSESHRFEWDQPGDRIRWSKS